MSTAFPTALEWKFSQVFGERTPGEDVQDVDIVSTVEFEKRGDFLATGDRGGRIVIFERTDGKDCHSRKELEILDYRPQGHPEYRYKTEFQSHEPEVKDHKVKKVKQMELNPFVCSENSLLSEKSFLIGKHEPSFINGYHLEWKNEMPSNVFPSSHEEFAKIANNKEATLARCRKIYAHAHDFNINSISNNSDGEIFVSADDLRINLWNLEVSNQCFNIIDMKPSNMEDLTEVITSAEFHPVYCNLLAYSSSRGFIRLIDMRQSALCDHHARIFQDREVHGPKSFFTEIIASISDIKFASDGRHILSRDYMNLKLWDLHMEGSPVATFKIHEYLRPKLSDLYNNDSIFDKFDCCLSGDGLHFATGSYSNAFRVFSNGDGSEEGTTLEASKNPNRKQYHQTTRTRRTSLSNLTRGYHRQGHEKSSIDSHGLPDLTSKLLHLAWHPTANLIACAAANSLYMYYA
ncbi:PREDICTED: serine/threonine protein phosphatase 2A 55 kDa regulatory subunit B beta isoform-like isoform X2 [Nelumbo nucifera]|uniref:Serine/threonine-protein phosphatase 2A 55 kDa regulatory subunit B n=1 Tax=Nelumbo nucifera TaxID=4432 RepID=A0A1U8Q2K6_NELNU|nr:PREDICTED: serine/threonine protein phosphatase 2A 55 kDa regulatory subunit B beta isoform-like isoform X2 [Nelumbo nucifera]